MKVTFVSNYINHHQIPVCNAMVERLGDNFTFIQTEAMEEERVNMGWDSQSEKLPFVLCSYNEPEKCQSLIVESDIVIWGGLEDESMLQPRLDMGKIVFRYSERLYKEGQWKWISPRGLLKKYKDHTQYRKDRVFLLCAGAYVPSDFHIVRAYPHKMIKWGYFPETKRYNVDKLMEEKRSEKKEILWAARFIDWKHPELVVRLAEFLKDMHISFHITMIGVGELESNIQSEIEEKGLQEYITLAGVQTPEMVRVFMEKASIYIVTSDRQEGWGAVLNEAMNSGCAVVASHMIGAARYLINQGQNGFMYQDGKEQDLLEKVLELIQNSSKREELGRAAYNTIIEEWNAETAVSRLMLQFEEVIKNGDIADMWKSGPCSRAEIIGEKESI